MSDEGAADVPGVVDEPSPPGGARSAKSRSLLFHRNFRLLLIGETTSKFGTSVTSVLLPVVAVTTLDAPAFLLGLLTAATWLPWLLIGLPAGAWVDQLPRRPVMLCANAVSAVLFASVPVAAWLGVLGIWHLVAVALLSGTAAVFFSTAYSAYLPSLVDTSELMEGNAKLQGSEQAAKVAGPGVGGLLAQTVGSASGLLLDAFSFVVSSMCLLAVRGVEPRPAVRSGRRLRAEISAGLRFVLRDPHVRILTAYGAAVNLALAGYQAVLVVFLVRSVGVDSGTLGALVAFGGVGGIAGGLLAGRLTRWLGTARGLLVVQLTASPFGLLIPLTRPGAGLALFAVGSVVVLAGVVACNVIIVSFRQSYCPPEMLGRVTATTLFLNYGTIPLGALLGGALGSLLGARPTMLIVTTALVAANGFLLGAPLRTLRDFPAASARA
ncbi:MFS transporter [Streptomyces sp. NPDC087300]|uniref:MFS transporter n=1 Tax=Streptomyces sp. NPDC087300 TaxID=3365780 RepID=UPI0037F32995